LNQSELAQVLQVLSQQQAAMLKAHADGLQLQRVLVEQMLAVGMKSEPLSSAVPDLTATLPAHDALNPVTSSRPLVDSASAPVLPAKLFTLSAVVEQHPAEPILATPSPDPEAPRPRDSESPSAPATEGPDVASPPPLPLVDTSLTEKRTELGAGGMSRGRAARYFQTHPTRPARVVTPHELAVLRSVSDAGDAARFILQFGPNRGATLGQVAQSDPTYLRELAVKAQRPIVRVAALKLVAALEHLEQQQKRTTGNHSSRTRPGAGR
jgi:hypothetical protein